MKKSYKYSAIALLIAGTVSAGSTMQLENGWNLVSTAELDNIDAYCILQKLSDKSIVWGWDNYTKGWYAKSNNTYMNSLISSYNITLLDKLEISKGYWILNTGNPIDINLSECTNTSSTDDGTTSSQCIQDYSEGPDFYFDGNLSKTVYDIFASGNIFFETDEEAGYGKFQIISSNEIKYERYIYDVNNNSFILDENATATFTINNDHNVTINAPDGNWDFILNNVENISGIFEDNGTISYITDMNLSAIEGEWVADETITDDWETTDWQPYYQGYPVTDIVTFKNMFIDPYINNWGGGSENTFMFEASTDTNITQGNIVEAIYNGCGYNYDSNTSYEQYIRGTNIIGQWSLDSTNNILKAELDTFIEEWTFDSNGKLQERYISKPGDIEKAFLLWSDNPVLLEGKIQTNIENEILQNNIN